MYILINTSLLIDNDKPRPPPLFTSPSFPMRQNGRPSQGDLF